MKNNLYSYHIADSRNICRLIRNKIVDVIITSPPYWNLKDYGVDNQIGFGQKYEKYLNELVTILDSCKNILKDNGSMWIIVDSFKTGGNIRLLPFEISNKLQEKGWHLQDIIIWQKDKTLPWSSKGKLRNIFEYILFFTKSKKDFKYDVDKLREIQLKKWWITYPERYNPKGKVPSRVWHIPIPNQGSLNSWLRHFCPLPAELVERILLLTTDQKDVVLDPFAGSGSVLAQAVVMKRRAIGLDLNKEYQDMYQSKVLPSFKDNWNVRKKELSTMDNKRIWLEDTIKKLRLLKYPKMLINQISLQGINNIRESLIGIGLHQVDDNSKAKYCFVFNESVNVTKVLELMEKLSKKKPLKKFNITKELNVSQDINDLQRTLSGNKELYIYDYKQPYIVKKEINLEDIKANIEENPYLISNLSVDTTKIIN